MMETIVKFVVAELDAIVSRRLVVTEPSKKKNKKKKKEKEEEFEPRNRSKCDAPVISVDVYKETVSYVDESNITFLNDGNFMDIVLKSEDIWLIEFYAQWCDYCNYLAPITA